jgi:hypothetical protein
MKLGIKEAHDTVAVAIKEADRRRKMKPAEGKKRILAYLAGLIIGGIIPSITWDIAHHQTQHRPILWTAVTGGLIYSAPMVAGWFSRYVGQVKGWGFVVALETAMTFTEGWTTLSALIVLVGLNAYILAGRFANDCPQ